MTSLRRTLLLPVLAWLFPIDCWFLIACRSYSDMVGSGTSCIAPSNAKVKNLMLATLFKRMGADIPSPGPWTKDTASIFEKWWKNHNHHNIFFPAEYLLGCIHAERDNWSSCRTDAQILTLGVHTESDEHSPSRHCTAEKPAHIFRHIIISSSTMAPTLWSRLPPLLLSLPTMEEVAAAS